MTTVRYEDNNLWQMMDFYGHAEDKIVCAGISAISQTLLANLLREEERGQITLQWDKHTPGLIWIRAWTNEENRDAIRAMFQFVAEGLRAIARDYPENLKMEERGNGNA